MAKITKRVWYSKSPTGQRQKRTAWGFTSQSADGNQIRRSDAGWSREDAEKELAKYQLGIVPTNAAAPTPGPTFRDAAERYLEVKRAERKRSIRDDEQNLARLRAAFGEETPLAGITAASVSAYKTQRAQEKPKRGSGDVIAAATLNRELATLRHLLRLAVEEWGWLDKAPVIRLMKEPQGRLRFLTDTEIVTLLNACQESQNPHLAAIVTLALNTGMRLGEIMGLTWERVDFSRGVLLLERTKSGRRREVLMTTEADAVLNTIPGDKVEGLVFRRDDGRRWGSIRTAFDQACRRAKLNDFRFHDLRHTYASHFMMRGGNLIELRDLLGHADIKMTTRYAHLSPAHLRTTVNRMAGLTPIIRPVDNVVDNPAPRASVLNTQSAHEVESGG
jgi:integrase